MTQESKTLVIIIKELIKSSFVFFIVIFFVGGYFFGKDRALHDNAKDLLVQQHHINSGE